MSKLIPGAVLTPAQRTEVFSVFVNRYHAIGPGRYYANDLAWLVDHAFYITRRGRLARRPNHCEPVFMVDTESKRG